MRFTGNGITNCYPDQVEDFISITVLTQQELDAVYARLFGSSGKMFHDQSSLVVDMVENEAKNCLNEAEGVNFEHKIVLSIAIRLAAERFMVDKIADPTFMAGVTKNQTPVLVQEFIARFGSERDAIKVLRKVSLMTPENIHLNAFMYEPILDMSDDSLKSLYTEVSDLK